MIPKLFIDVSYRNILKSFCHFFNPLLSRKKICNRIQEGFPHRYALPIYTVRTGFDLLFRCLNFPPESEIVMTSISIKDMFEIPERWGCKVLPLDFDIDQCAIDIECLSRIVTPKTKMIVISHLFGAIFDLERLFDFLDDRKDILVVEDCAQSYRGLNSYTGHPKSDVVLFSFGTIKVATACGGGLLVCKDSMLFQQITQVQRSYPCQSRFSYLAKLYNIFLLKIFFSKPVYAIFIFICKLLKFNCYELLYLKKIRAFPKGDFYEYLQFQPSPVLMQMIYWQMSYDLRDAKMRRSQIKDHMAQYLLPELRISGMKNKDFIPWLLLGRHKYAEKIVSNLSFKHDLTTLTTLKVAKGAHESLVSFLKHTLLIPVNIHASQSAYLELINDLNRELKKLDEN